MLVNPKGTRDASLDGKFTQAKSVEAPAFTSARPTVGFHDAARLRRGQRVFQQNCAVCHGRLAEGHPDWRKLGMDGKFPPPPLNGTGHDWHHPKAALVQVIKNGSPGGKGNMPAWQGKLSDQEIEGVIAWFQSLWPPEVRTVWARIDRESKRQ
ncbi:MAG: cytochrome c [Gammaproteobacteria bacterium]|nr:cytochrome c [Gammaproteobacteria bacterium]MBU1979377.1 cytochrome c [Gammaproteobacteria bacterium]